MEFWDHLFLFKRLYDQTMEPIAQRWDLTRMELDILLFLANAPAYDTAADIVERRRLTKSHVSVSIHSLVRRGWLERSYLPGNRKSAHLRLLPASAPAVADGQGRSGCTACAAFPGDDRSGAGCPGIRHHPHR